MKKLILSALIIAATTTTAQAQPPLELVCQGQFTGTTTTTASTCPFGTKLVGYR